MFIIALCLIWELVSENGDHSEVKEGRTGHVQGAAKLVRPDQTVAVDAVSAQVTSQRRYSFIPAKTTTSQTPRGGLVSSHCKHRKLP